MLMKGLAVAIILLLNFISLGISSSVENHFPDSNGIGSFESLFFTHDVGVDDIIEWPGGHKESWDLLFEFDCAAASGGGGNAGTGFDGYFFYSTRLATNLIHKYDLSGDLVEEFSIPGVSGLCDLAYDGDFFYGGAAGGTIWVMDFDTYTLVDTISGSFESCAIAYDSDFDVFYCSNWSDPVYVVDRTGCVLDLFDLVTATNAYGMAYDNLCDDGPSLWVFDQTPGAEGTIYQWDLTAGAFTGFSYDVQSEIGSGEGIAGGLFTTADYIEGKYCVGGLIQDSDPPGVGDYIFVYELCESFGYNHYEPGTYPIDCIVKNYGTDTEVDFNVHAEIIDIGKNSDDLFWEDDYFITTPIASNETVRINFSNVTFSTFDEGEYKLIITTELSTDENHQNDHKIYRFFIDYVYIPPPETTHEFYGAMGENGWFVSDVIIELTAFSVIGINATYYSIEDFIFELYMEPFLCGEEGEHELYYYSVDVIGQWEELNGPFPFKIDTTLPSINLTATYIGGNTWVLNAAVYDETSGVAKVEFYLDGDLLGEDSEEPFEWEWTGTGSHTAYAIVYDIAGNSKQSEVIDSIILTNQQSTHPMFHWFLNRFPNAFPILRNILGFY